MSDAMQNEPNGWSSFSLAQAHAYIAEMKATYPRAWTGVYRCAEQMTTMAQQETERADTLARLLRSATHGWSADINCSASFLADVNAAIAAWEKAREQ